MYFAAERSSIAGFGFVEEFESGSPGSCLVHLG